MQAAAFKCEPNVKDKTGCRIPDNTSARNDINNTLEISAKIAFAVEGDIVLLVSIERKRSSFYRGLLIGQETKISISSIPIM